MHIISSLKDKKAKATVYTPENQQEKPSEDESVGLAQAALDVAKSNVVPGTIAKGAWDLTSLPANYSQPEIAEWLVGKNINPAKATDMAGDIRELFNHPAVRSVLVGTSAAAAAYVVIEKTTWSKSAKLWATAAVLVLVSLGYYVLQNLGWVV